VIAVLDERGVKGTFFVQGMVAEAFPGVVQTLAMHGHEIQSHGYSHRPLFAMNRRQLRTELERARASVEDAGGIPVTAFRAQDFSIRADNLWALEVIAEVGFRIDSSIFPIRMPHYGIAGWDLGPKHVELDSGATILEVPVAVWARGRLRLPVAGGGYFRVLPQALLERMLRAIAAGGRPPVIYCHPYEFNPNELDDYRPVVRRSLRLTQGVGRSSLVERVRRLLAGLPFGRFDETLAVWGIA
jgi:polysaccharide deacetylase family protein (PEP-CTERM system associated)